MSAEIIVALIAAGSPAAILTSAASWRTARNARRDLNSRVGVTNGDGTLVEMTTKALVMLGGLSEAVSELKAGQEDHSRRLDAIEGKLPDS